MNMPLITRNSRRSYKKPLHMKPIHCLAVFITLTWLQGGVRAPAFFHYPRAMQAAAMNDSVITVKDIMPTLLELAGIEHPGAWRGSSAVKCAVQQGN